MKELSSIVSKVDAPTMFTRLTSGYVDESDIVLWIKNHSKYTDDDIAKAIGVNRLTIVRIRNQQTKANKTNYAKLKELALQLIKETVVEQHNEAKALQEIAIQQQTHNSFPVAEYKPTSVVPYIKWCTFCNKSIGSYKDWLKGIHSECESFIKEYELKNRGVRVKQNYRAQLEQYKRNLTPQQIEVLNRYNRRFNL